jgi:hypothetical protein
MKISPYLSPSLEEKNHVKPNENAKKSKKIKYSRHCQRKLFLLRAFLLIILVMTGLLSGTLLAIGIRNSRQRLKSHDFNDRSQGNFRAIKHTLSTKTQSSIQVALNKGLDCPFSADWPNCPFSSTLLNRRTKVLSSISVIDHFYVAPIVSSDQRQSFKEFAQTMIETDGGFPPGIEDLGNFTINEYLDRIPISKPSNSTLFDISVPVTEISNLTMVADLLFFDSYPDSRYFIDKMTQCGANHPSPTLDDNSIQFNCSFMSTMFPTTGTSPPVGLIAVPITPYFSPSTIVGFLGTQFNWKLLLESALMDDSSFDFKIESPSLSRQYHYSVRHGHVYESEKPHENLSLLRRLTYGRDLSRSFSLDDDVKLTYYTTHDDDSVDFLPLVAFLSCLGITVLISGIFLTFNALVEEETQKSESLLDSKRVFVRFISHEIR